jgi:Inner membrane component domain
MSEELNPRALTPTNSQITEEQERTAIRLRIQEEELIRHEMRQRLQSASAQTAQQIPMPQQPVIINNVINNTNVVNNKIHGSRKHSIIIRLLYFCTVGWLIGTVWLSVALLACITVVGLPFGILMLSKAKAAYFL